jgi:hypothetical protein
MAAAAKTQSADALTAGDSSLCSKKKKAVVPDVASCIDAKADEEDDEDEEDEEEEDDEDDLLESSGGKRRPTRALVTVDSPPSHAPYRLATKSKKPSGKESSPSSSVCRVSEAEVRSSTSAVERLATKTKGRRTLRRRRDSP